MAYITGKSGIIALSGQNGFSGQLIWSEEYDIAANASLLTMTLQIKSTKYYVGYFPNGTIKVDNTDAFVMNSLQGTHNIDFPFHDTWRDIKKHGGALAFPIKYGPIYHNQDGKKTVTIAVDVALNNNVSGTGSGSKVSGSQNITLTDIPRFATITSATDFNDEETPTITYSNPAGSSVTSLQACISLDGSDPNADASVAVKYRNIPVTGTSYTFDDITAAELYAIHYATTGGNSRKVYFKMKTVIGGTVGYSQVERTFTIANPNPVINPTIIDTDESITDITGDNKILVRYHSNASVASNAYAVKAATLTFNKVTCGSRSINGQNGVINNIDSGTFTFYAKDSRGNETTRVVTPTSGIFSFVDYVRPTCVLANHLPDTDGKMLIEISGNYFNGNIGKTPNNLTVQYRYKPVGGSYYDWKPVTYKSVNETLYYASAEESGLDYQTAYVFQARAIDIFEEVQSVEKTVKSTPVFDWGENDFKFNVPVYDEFGVIIRNGKAAYSAPGTDSIDPDTTLEELCYTDHENGPRQDQWFFIKTMFYNNPNGLPARSQIAIPSGATMSMYHRYSVTDQNGNLEWSAWRRHLNEDEHYSQTKLLWTNASPTSAFAAQTLAISLADYEIIMIESKQGSTFCKVGEVTVMFSRDSYYPCTRDVTTTTTGISFGSGLQRTECPGSGTATGNWLCIPRRIYGIKGVIK